MIGFQEQITMLQEELTKLAPEAAVLTHQRDTLQSEVGSSNSACVAGLVSLHVTLVPAEAALSVGRL